MHYNSNTIQQLKYYTTTNVSSPAASTLTFIKVELVKNEHTTLIKASPTE